MHKWLNFFLIIGVLCYHVFAEKRSLYWYGGGVDCEAKKLFFIHRQCETENVIATKAITANSELFVITPRFRRGIPATIWKVIQDSPGVRLEPFLDSNFHTISDCEAIQNAIDFHLDALGNIWILDNGVVETLTNPKCTCHPKVSIVNVFLRRTKVKKIDLSSVVQPESVLQSIIVEFSVGLAPFMYISDAGTGRIIVHDITKNKQWTVNTCEPTSSMDLALVKSSPSNSALVVVRQNQSGWLQRDTAELRRKGKYGKMKVNNENTPPITLLGSDQHYIYFRYTAAHDVFAWKVRQPFNNTSIQLIHSPDPELNTTSVAIDSLNNYLILDTNYVTYMSKGNDENAYQKLTFMPRIKL